jgi:uncharacterized membrane protein YeaQ/YmgE (transglycosylase-associated protein family)
MNPGSSTYGTQALPSVACNLPHILACVCIRRPIGASDVVIRLVFLGLLAGFIASHLVKHRGEGMVLDILLGIVGAIVGGWLFHLFGATGVTQLSLYSVLVAVAGAVVVLFVYHAIRRGVVGRRIF